MLLGWGLEPAYDTIPFSLYRIALVGMGALIASRQPRNPVGWIFTVGGLVDIPGGLGPAYGARAAERAGREVRSASGSGSPPGCWVC